MDNNQPSNPSGMMILVKLIIGLVFGIIFSMLIFLLFFGLGATIDQALNNSQNSLAFSPLVWLSFMGIATIISILGTLLIALIYNIIWEDEYYDIKIISSGILLSNLLIFIIFLLLYVYIGSFLADMDKLFLVYGFHLFFSIFISFTIIDLIKNPNYSPVYIIGNAFGFIFTILVFIMIYSVYSGKGGDAKKILFYPAILAFSLIPFISTVWEKLYYKFYEMGSDFLYVPSLSEVLVDEEDVDEANVDIN